MSWLMAHGSGLRVYLILYLGQPHEVSFLSDLWTCERYIIILTKAYEAEISRAMIMIQC
jgi:hypothetical protein